MLVIKNTHETFFLCFDATFMKKKSCMFVTSIYFCYNCRARWIKPATVWQVRESSLVSVVTISCHVVVVVLFGCYYYYMCDRKVYYFLFQSYNTHEESTKNKEHKMLNEKILFCKQIKIEHKHKRSLSDNIITW